MKHTLPIAGLRVISLLIVAMGVNCSGQKNQTMDQGTVTEKVKPELKSYSISNKNGLKATITNFGGRMVSLWVPDRKGELGDVVLGFDSLKQYTEPNPYFGALIGRYGNRIAKGKFTLEGKEYQLSINNGANALHGGPGGFHNVYWEVTPVDGNSLRLTYVSPDGEESYPGTLKATVIYTLTDSNELTIDYNATTDQTTIVNLTHHSYFNLDGVGDVLGHKIMIAASQFTPVDSSLIPTGEKRSVKGTPFDFIKSKTIGLDIEGKDDQLIIAKGYDHNFVLNKKGNELSMAARVIGPVSGRVMEVWTTEPGLQFYTGNFLDGKLTGKNGKPCIKRSGFCLEAQHFPDSPNHADFPTVVLKPGETYSQKTVYKFLID